MIKWIETNKDCPKPGALKALYTGLTKEDMEGYKMNYNQHGCLTLEAAQLYPEEKMSIIDMFMEQVSLEDIANKLLIHIDVVVDVC